MGTVCSTSEPPGSIMEGYARTSYICSNHFQHSDYIIPPTQNGTCRLKKYVIPSRFNNVHVQPTTSTTHPDALLNRLELSNKRPLAATSVDNMMTHLHQRKSPNPHLQKKKGICYKKSLSKRYETCNNNYAAQKKEYKLWVKLSRF